jgi:hypothetical protein
MPVRLAPRPVFLVGREVLLADVHAHLALGAERAGPRVVVLCGLPGAGKTSAAVEYAYRHLGEVGACWQFAAGDPAVLAAQFAVLAAQLGARDLADARDPVAAVHAVLARASTPWLLVFDNVPDLAAVQDFLPPAGAGRVLVTSQSQHWPAGWSVQVPVLDPAVAAQFLATRTGDTHQDAALELARDLGGLPLALEQAAAYMQATGTSLARYLQLFRGRQADLLARGEAAGHRGHTAATLGLALARLEEEAPAAAGLMRLLAFLAPEPVPLDLVLIRQPAATQRARAARLVGPLLGDSVAVTDAVAALRRYSLASLAGDGLVQVHRLVKAVARSQLTRHEATRWKKTATALVEAAVPANGELPSVWPQCAAVLPHALAVLELTSRGMKLIVEYLGQSGSHSAAREMYVLIADAHQNSASYGPGHPDTLAARLRLAYWTGEAGDAAEARDQYGALLPVHERILGPDHPDVLTTRATLARWTGEAGDAAGAREQYAALLPDRERILGPEHPHTLTTRVSIAYLTGVVGDAAAARDQLAGLLPVRRRVLGPGHPQILSTRHGLARFTGEAGHAAGARDQYADLLPDRVRIMGADHPDVLRTRASLARWTGEAGDAAGARDQYAALLPDAERILGPGHPDVLRTRSSLAIWAERAKDADTDGS